MAVDKNSKAYQSLQKSGYTDEQIGQMHDTVASGQGAKDVIANTTAANPNENKQSQPMLDPIAYRPEYNTPKEDKYIEGWDASKLNNADINISQYGDDSSSKNYNNSALRGGENQKYTGENTLGSQVAYNKDATLEGLDPNYKYGQAAQMQNSQEANYIARRNDEIASALYNAGKTSIEDVANFLSQQNQWDYSNENERQNTIQAVWKRIGQIAEQNLQGTENPVETENDPLENMKSDLLKSTAGELYGKVTADQNTAIQTLEDENSVYRAMNEARIQSFKNLQSMSSEKVAYLLNEGQNIFSDQSMRDLMQYDPAKYQEIQSELKKIRGQDVIDQISTGGKIDLTNQINNDENNVNSEMNSFVNKTADERNASSLSTNLSNALSESEIVSGAREQMEVYKRKIEDIQQAADELPSLANKYFKGDVPQYIVNAFVANRMQQYNKELQKYQNLYNASLDEAKFEISQAQWREEMDYKWKNLKADQDYRDANLQLQREQMAADLSSDAQNRRINLIKGGQWNKDGSFSYINESGKMVTISASSALGQTNEMLSSNADAFLSTWQKKMDNAKLVGDACYGGQCEEFTDNYANQFYGVTMVGDGHAYTTAEEKAGYANVFTPYKGVVAIWNYENGTENMKKYGHTAVVMDFDPTTGDYTFMESNGDGNSTVGIRKKNIYSDGNLVGFRDPTKPSLKEQEENGIYNYYETPMTEYFESAIGTSKTEGERSSITKAADAYSLLYELNDNGYIDKIVTSDVLQNIISSIDASTFAADGNDNGAAFFEQLPSYIRNKVKDDDYAHAINRLFRLIEVKLREESGAAINSAEWKSQFIRYLPQAGASEKLKRDNLRDLEKDTVYGRVPYGTDAKKYYKEIIPTTSASEKKKKSKLEAAQDAIINAIKKQNGGK